MTYLKRTSQYYKEMLFLIYEKFGTGRFTCDKIRHIKGMRKFRCQQLRSWHNDDILEFRWVKYAREKPVREWRFTQSSLRYFTGLP